MSPTVRRTLVYFHLCQAVVRLRHHEPLEETVVALLDALFPLWPDED